MEGMLCTFEQALQYDITNGIAKVPVNIILAYGIKSGMDCKTPLKPHPIYIWLKMSGKLHFVK